MKGIRLKKAVLSDFRFAVQMSHNVETHVILEIPCFYPYVLLQRKMISGLDHPLTNFRGKLVQLEEERYVAPESLKCDVAMLHPEADKWSERRTFTKNSRSAGPYRLGV